MGTFQKFISKFGIFIKYCKYVQRDKTRPKHVNGISYNTPDKASQNCIPEVE